MSKDLKQVLKDWDNGDIVWTIERGGLGCGYEQVIQIGVFELCKKLQDEKIPIEEKELNDFFDLKLKELIKQEPILQGLSGAQAGAITGLAYRFLVNGYQETLKSAKENGLTLIQVDNNFPVTIQKAVKILSEHLKLDKDYYYSWQSNIAMAFYDAYYQQAGIDNFVTKGELHKICNDAATQFLRNLIGESK